MWNSRAFMLSCCLAALPLLGCGGPAATAQQAYPTAPAYASPGPAAYAPRAITGAPVAVLVFLPGADALAARPDLWAAQGFQVMTPRLLPAANASLVADQIAALDRMLIEAQTLANAPLWLVGQNAALLDAIGRFGHAPVSGMVLTGAGPGGMAGVMVCQESVTITNPGNGAPPKVTVQRAGNACPPTGATSGGAAINAPNMRLPGNAGGGARLVPTAPRPVPPSNPPKLIEASVQPGNEAPAIARIAQLIKQGPAG